MNKKTISNGKPKPNKDHSNEEINYPVDFDFKALMDASIDDEKNKQNLINVFKKHNIKYAYHNKKVSSKGTYVSFTYKITIISKEVMQKFYAELKTVEGLKFAL